MLGRRQNNFGSISAVHCQPNIASTLGWCRPPTWMTTFLRENTSFQPPQSRQETLAHYDTPTTALWQNAFIPLQRRQWNTNLSATSAADHDDADQCRSWANVTMLAGRLPGQVKGEFRPQVHRVSLPEFWDHFYYHGLTLIPAWISNHMSSKVWDEITYPFPNFNGCTVEVWEWISNPTL